MMNSSLLKLLKCYIGEQHTDINEKALKYGICISKSAPIDVVDTAIKMYGKDGFLMNQTFHKDYATVAQSSIETLAIQQIVHYITTYYFEKFGIYSEDTVYIPKEELNVPELKDGIKLINIRCLTEEQVKEALMNLLTSGIALSDDTMQAIMDVSNLLDKDKFDDIKNKEMRMMLYDKYGIAPRNADEFVRYLIYKTTGSSLKIKDTATLTSMMTTLEYDYDAAKIRKLLNWYIDYVGIEKLAAVFYRNKPFFLTLKRVPELRKTVNKIRKLAYKYHKPMKQSILNCLTARDFTDDEVVELDKALETATPYRMISLLNALRYRNSGNTVVDYVIRNGKSFATTAKANPITDAEIKEAIIYKHLIEKLSANVKDKVVYLPDHIYYAAPTSEKNFIGELPSGSYIELPRDNAIVYGIHWYNLDRGRVDLDLRQYNVTENYGWNTDYKDASNNILFSGDMTDAPKPKGATEVFYVKPSFGKGAYTVSLNNFTNYTNEDIPYQLIFAKADHKPTDYICGYSINPNNVLAQLNAKLEPGKSSANIGTILITDDSVKFIFKTEVTGNQCVSQMTEWNKLRFEHSKEYTKYQVELLELLIAAGARIVNTPTVTVDDKEIPADIDLSLESITKETIIKLFV